MHVALKVPSRLLLLSVVLALFAGCPEPTPTPDGGDDPVEDAGTNPGDDAGTNPGDDAGTNPGDDAGTNPGDDAGTNPGDDAGVEVPPETKSIAQLRNPAVNGYLAPCPDGQFTDCGDASLHHMVVVTEPYYITGGNNGPLFGMIIADPTEVDGSGRLLPYSGIEVTISPEHPNYPPMLDGYDFAQTPETYEWVNPALVPAPGDVVDLVGQNSLRYGMPQFRFVSSLTKVGTADTVADVTMPLPAQFDGNADAAAVNHPSKLQGGRPSDNVPPSDVVDGYLAVWVELINVETTNACLPSPYTPFGGAEFDRDFGYFLVTGDVEMGDHFEVRFSGRFPEMTPVEDQICANQNLRCGDSRSLGQTFTSLQGVMDIYFDVYRLNPRTVDDYAGATLSMDMCP